MKPIMHLYDDKVMITDKKELMPLLKSSTIHVAASKESGIIYTNVSKEELDDFISENMLIQSNLMLLKLAIEIAPEVKTVLSLRIADDDSVSIEETSKADVLMINKSRMIIIAGIDGKIYTNNALVAKKCVQDDVVKGDFAARLLKALIDMDGLTECELKIE